MQSLEQTASVRGRLPVALHRQGDPLLDLQLWMLGQDRLHPAGNALARYGFTRSRHPEGHGSSGYLLPLGGPHHVALVCWGYGVYLGPVQWTPPVIPAPPAAPVQPPEPGGAGAAVPGVLLERHAFGPKLLPAPVTLPLRAKAQLGVRLAPRAEDQQRTACAGVIRTAALLAAYERWAVVTLGDAHRHRALAALPRHKRRRLPTAPSLADAWDALGRSLSGAT
jgi:hypothetical protein